MKSKFKFLQIFVLLTLTACSGGGGGGEGSSESTSTTGVRIMHGGIDSAPMELTSAGDSKVLQTAIYAESKGYAPVGTGQKTITVTPKGSAGPVFSQGFAIDKNQGFSILVFGERGGSGVRSALIDETPTITDQTSVKFVNGLIGSSFIRVRVGTNTVSDPIGIGTSSEYIPLQSDVINFTVFNSSGGVVHSAERTLESGKAHSVLIVGQESFLVVDEVFKNN